MTVNLARTADGWWAVTPAGLVRLDLPAATTAGLLADRAALAAAACAASTAAVRAARSASSPAVVAPGRSSRTSPAGVTAHQPSAVRARLTLMSPSP